MTSRSAKITTERPFYDLHADAYDALITDPVQPWVDAVDDRLRAAGLSSASVLDAGCGTGRHAQALLERGHRVSLLDASPRLLTIASSRCPGSSAHQTDICAPKLRETFEAIMCRGVLNDLVLDEERDAALGSFAALLGDNGLLFLDVREIVETRQRADGQWRRTEAALDGGETLKFASRPLWRADRLVVEERYELVGRDGSSSVHDYVFEMRPWTRDELTARLTAAGFSDIGTVQGVGRRTPDRLFVTARRPV
ncbi:class I SAM-dependent methyltransferase [Kribbella pittospori]|uniref:class I SAM-dependent methyltransferase n=1 Tax=Kribbella pittospori TaxID=722689 RepID=UPI0013F3E8DC|nr:class I SAM-dependent methyltransferase [Kribbella pittospori]